MKDSRVKPGNDNNQMRPSTGSGTPNNAVPELVEGSFLLNLGN